jgi:hypothetical protein
LTRLASIRHAYHIAILHPHEPRILLLSVGDSWQLPGFSLEQHHLWQDVAHINAWVKTMLGAAVFTLRCLDLDYVKNGEVEQISKIYLVELRDTHWQAPPGAIWAGPHEFTELWFSQERQRRVLLGWYDWQATADPVGRAAWYRRGWFEAAGRWAAHQIRTHGIPLTDKPQQLRSWQRSAILRIPTTKGLFFFKAVPAMFGFEPELTHELYRTDPRRFPRPLAIDAEQGWMLLYESTGTSLDRQTEIERWEPALAEFAQLQIAGIRQVDRLRAIGLPERPLTTLLDRFDRLLTDSAAMLSDRSAGLSPDQIAELRDQRPYLRRLCSELIDYGIPPTLEHGDFWAGQIIDAGDHYVFLDWSDSSIAHPFFSMLLFLMEAEDFLPRERQVRERLRNAYLHPWHSLLDKRALLRAFTIAQPLAAIHHALSYHQLILPNMEIGWEMELMIPFYLKMALRLLPTTQP